MGKKALPALAIIVLLFIAVLVVGLTYFWVPPKTMMVSEFIYRGAPIYKQEAESGGLTFYRTSGSGFLSNRYIRDKAKVGRFVNLIEGKKAIRLSDPQGEELYKEGFSYIELGTSGKGRCVSVFRDGRIAFTIYTSEYRNRSRLYWLRWKIDNYGSRHTGITYLTEPDPSVSRTADELFEAARSPGG